MFLLWLIVENFINTTIYFYEKNLFYPTVFRGVFYVQWMPKG